VIRIRQCAKQMCRWGLWVRNMEQSVGVKKRLEESSRWGPSMPLVGEMVHNGTIGPSSPFSHWRLSTMSSAMKESRVNTFFAYFAIQIFTTNTFCTAFENNLFLHYSLIPSLPKRATVIIARYSLWWTLTTIPMIDSNGNFYNSCNCDQMASSIVQIPYNQ